MPKYLSDEYTPTQKLYHALFDELPKRDLAKEEMPILIRVLETLTERGPVVIKKRFGLGCESMTLQAVADEHGLSSNRIRQIEAKALRQLRHESRAKHIRPLFYTYVEMGTEIRRCKEIITETQDALQSLQEENYHLRQRVRELGIAENETPPIFSTHPALDWPIDKLRLSVRAYNRLWRARLYTVRDVVLKHNNVVKISGLTTVRDMGICSVEEVLGVLDRLGIPLDQPEERHYK